MNARLQKINDAKFWPRFASASFLQAPPYPAIATPSSATATGAPTPRGREKERKKENPAQEDAYIALWVMDERRWNDVDECFRS